MNIPLVEDIKMLYRQASEWNPHGKKKKFNEHMEKDSVEWNGEKSGKKLERDKHIGNTWSSIQKLFGGPLVPGGVVKWNEFYQDFRQTYAYTYKFEKYEQKVVESNQTW